MEGGGEREEVGAEVYWSLPQDSDNVASSFGVMRFAHLQRAKFENQGITVGESHERRCVVARRAKAIALVTSVGDAPEVCASRGQWHRLGLRDRASTADPFDSCPSLVRSSFLPGANSLESNSVPRDSSDSARRLLAANADSVALHSGSLEAAGQTRRISDSHERNQEAEDAGSLFGRTRFPHTT